jgi:hypothetical protein
METLELTRQALHLLAPFVAADAPAQTDATSPDRTTHPVARAWELIGSGVQDNPPAEQALAIYRDEPDDQRNRERLARHLADHLHRQPQARDELRTIVAQLQQAQPAVQQGGSNPETATQTNQTINNNAPNQGAQGEFHGPVNITHGSVDARDADFSGAQGVNISGVTINKRN